MCLTHISSHLQESRRDALAGIAAAGAAFVPAAANAAAGESPRFSVFGLFGDGSAYSEGAAYGTDQGEPLYSPYSVYGERDEDSLYKPGAPEYIARKVAVLEETKKRLALMPAYVEDKEWFEVSNELRRYMYETRSSIAYLSKTFKQKEAADEFYLAIEEISNNARLKKQAECAAAIKKSVCGIRVISFIEVFT